MLSKRARNLGERERGNVEGGGAGHVKGVAERKADGNRIRMNVICLTTKGAPCYDENKKA